jgi:1,4-dihydroxy-6-naphthoate synthase
MKITIGFSTCPNDTYIFDALVNNKIDTGGLDFIPVLSDVEDLNKRAFRTELDVTKLSYHAWLHVWKDYQVLESGSALGRGNGPLLVSAGLPAGGDLSDSVIATPGEFTTACLLLKLAYPGIVHTRSCLFSEIEDIVLAGQADAGVLIHENRFTYQRRGLKLVRDLGEFWESTTGMPIPLGGIMVNRRIPNETKIMISGLIRNSLEFANENPSGTLPYIRRFAQSMEDDVLEAHLKTFVTDFSIDLGREGRVAILKLAQVALEKGLVPELPHDIFLT